MKYSLRLEYRAATLFRTLGFGGSSFEIPMASMMEPSASDGDQADQ